ncbi:MFS transporter [Commensalibacter oyaizuii]|uniref:MFS transporter n=1 Tax=Commensalibacter oyaizuii TaxID=3043873 RepID=A0ABT6Q003_9PROT|nr:MFS transporter [Commensalibacter sp. TBRC 16381]MDI2090433.1 MFS transporter [Commensalibacter sp. TBRC 16381]
MSELKEAQQPTYWSAVFSLFMGVTSLIAAEFIPISLLTNIASDLHITEGQAGQSVTAVGIFAVLTSLFIAPLTRKIDKRRILLLFSTLLILSNICVAFAHNFITLLAGRCVLGICVGGFWSLTSAVVLQLVPSNQIPKALSIIYTGVSVATIISLPFANYIGYLLGWRTIFHLVAVLGMITLIWQYFSLPSLLSPQNSSFQSIQLLLKQSWVIYGLLAIVCSYAGYHIFFTYLKPFLQYSLSLPPYTLTLTLLCFGLVNCFGTLIAGFLLNKSFRITMIMIHVILSLVALLFFINSQFFIGNLINIFIWGLIFGIIPVGWSTWITRTLTNQAEIAGGLMVAAIQLSITIAAAIGGLLFDHYGIHMIFIASFSIFITAIFFTVISFKSFYEVKGKPV